MFQWIASSDAGILLWIQDYIRQDWLSPIVIFITHLGDNGYIWIALTILMLISKRTRKIGCLMACSLIGSLIVDNLILKPLVARIRPYEVIQNLQLIIPPENDFSFPSGHTGSSFAAAVVMFQVMPRREGVPALVLAFLIALSRLYVGVHYPTDVLSGMIIGTVIALLTCKYMPGVIDRLEEKMKKRRISKNA